MNHPMMDTVREYIDAFNEGNVEGMAAQFAASGSILDGIAPHLWQGPTAARDWYRDLLKEGQHLGATAFAVTPAEPLHNIVTGDTGYVVLPVSMTFTVLGKQHTQTGAIFTVALRKFAGF